jgi:toxin ParE1/3/4
VTRYVLSPAALRDLEEGSRYGDMTFGEAATDRYFADLDRTFELIAQFPLIARERKEYDPPVRIHRHARHYVIYVALKRHVRVLRVLREEADLGRHLRRSY